MFLHDFLILAISEQQSDIDPPLPESIKQSILQDLTPLQVTPVSPSPPPSITDEVPADTPSIFQSINNQSINEIENISIKSNKRLSDDEQLSPSKRSRCSLSSSDSNEKSDLRLIFDEILIGDKLLIKFDFKQKKEYSAKCLEKDPKKKQLFVHYRGLDSK